MTADIKNLYGHISSFCHNIKSNKIKTEPYDKSPIFRQHLTEEEEVIRFKATAKETCSLVWLLCASLD